MRTRVSWLRWIVLRAAVLAGLLTALSGTAFAHATLVRSDPADGATLAEAPRELRMWFSEAISPVFSSARVFDINNQPVAIAGLRADPAEPKLLIVDLGELPDGVFSVLSKLLSEADGHFSRTFLVFGVGENADLGAAVVADTRLAPPLPEVGLRWINYGALTALAGALAVLRLVIIPAFGAGVGSGRRSSVHARVLRWAAWCCAVALLAGTGLLIWQAVTLLRNLPEEASFPSVVGQVLAHTRWGWTWLLRELLLVVLAVELVLAHRAVLMPAPDRQAEARSAQPLASPRRWLRLGLLAAAVLAAQALTGHAAAATPDTALAVAADWVHLVSASVWVGGLLALAIGLLPEMRPNGTDYTALAHAGWAPFSRYAAVSVGLLFATGLYALGRHVESMDALLMTLYGQALAAKIGLVLLVGICGLLNSMLLHPQRVAAPLARALGRPIGWTPLPLRRLPLLVCCEAGLALLVLSATGLITATQTARGPEFRALPDHIPAALSQSADDMLMTLSVKPNRPGQNVFTVFTASTRRPPPAEIMRVILRFTYLDQEMARVSVNAEQVERGRFLVGGNYLSLVGSWRIEVITRRKGLQDSTARFDWTLPPPGGARPVLLSRTSLERPTSVAAAVILLFVLGAVALAGWYKRRRPLPPPAVPTTRTTSQEGGTHHETAAAQPVSRHPFVAAPRPRSECR